MRLEERIERLERSACRWRLAAVSLLVVGGLGLVLAAAPAADEPQALKVKSLSVVNDDGKIVAALISSAGEGQFHLVSSKTSKPVFSAGSGGMVVGDGAANVSVTPGATGSSLVITNKAGKQSMMLYPDEKGVGHISLLRDGKSVVWEAPPR